MSIRILTTYIKRELIYRLRIICRCMRVWTKPLENKLTLFRHFRYKYFAVHLLQFFFIFYNWELNQNIVLPQNQNTVITAEEINKFPNII